jgi:dihydroorotase
LGGVKQDRPLTITGGKLVRGSRTEPGSLRLSGGRIEAAGDVAPRDGDHVIDAKGAWIAPGLVDLGVFAVDKPAFRFGGITRAALMPDQSPPLDYPARINFIAKSGKPDLWVHPLAAASLGLRGERLSDMALMRAAGARGISTGRSWIADTALMLNVCEYAAMLGLPVIAHAEDGFLAGSAVASAGEMATRLGLPAALPEAEALALSRDSRLAQISGAHVHFRQVTTRAGLDVVREAKSDGVRVTAGVTPAHFLLSDLATADFRSFARLSPPLRSEDDRHAVRDAIADGTIDCISSGHDPRGTEEKRLPFADASPGMAGAQTLLALTLCLVRDGTIDLAPALALLTKNPARILGVEAGVLEPGLEADILLFDPEHPWIIDAQSLPGMAGNTPFDGQPTQGRALRVFKGGVELFEEGSREEPLR